MTNKDNRWIRQFSDAPPLISEWGVSTSHGLVEERFLWGMAKIGFNLKPLYKDDKMVVLEKYRL